MSYQLSILDSVAQCRYNPITTSDPHAFPLRLQTTLGYAFREIDNADKNLSELHVRIDVTELCSCVDAEGLSARLHFRMSAFLHIAR
jgi:hypothetical protein